MNTKRDPVDKNQIKHQNWLILMLLDIWRDNYKLLVFWQWLIGGSIALQLSFSRNVYISVVPNILTGYWYVIDLILVGHVNHGLVD